MWRTPISERTLQGPEAELIREILGCAYDELQDGLGEPLICRIPKFKELTPNQQAALLVDVGEALLREDVPAPALNAMNESAVAALFDRLETHVDMEIDGCTVGVPSTAWRQCILDACKWDIEKGAPSLDDEEDSLPDANSDDTGEWQILIESLSSCILWDRDYLNESIEDMPPEESKYAKFLYDISDGYFEGIAPDPRDDEMPAIYARLSKIAGHPSCQ